MSNDDDRTRILKPSKDQPGDARTRMIRPGATKQGEEDGGDAATRVVSAGASGESLSDGSELVAGWLVVLSGPGRGASREVYFGMNTIGRDAGERIPLNFGDESISRSAHAYLVYDEKQNQFYLQHAGKSNLVRVNDAPVLAPTELNHGDRVEIGGTILMFVPLCSPSFQWDDA